jgi:NADPH:quinone reductase-like Zn-dependent oxidoreductase
MKAFILDRYGSKVALRLGEMADPDVRDDDVLVQVHAAGVNLLDSKIRSGEFKLILPYRVPFVLVRVGAGVKHFEPGDEVHARPADHRIGTFAELIAIQEKDLALKPRKLTMEEAASIPLVGLTAWQALVERGQLKRGQKVFIQAGSGGVGTFAIQLAKHLGATVATTTSASNIDLVRSLGADVIVDYKSDDFEAKLSGYDLVLHSQDGKALEKSLRVLRAGGRLVSISGPPDPDFAEEIGAPWFVKLFTRLSSLGARRRAKRLDTTFSFLFMKASGDQLRRIAALIDAGHVRPVVDKVFPFQSTNEALAYVETGRARGKVVIKVR